MSRNKKLANILAGLGKDVTVVSVEEIPKNNGDTEIDITVTHKVRIGPCETCGSNNVIKHGRKQKASEFLHIPQGNRKPCKILYRKQRLKCNECGAFFLEDIPWVYSDSKLTLPLAQCMEEDLGTLMTKKDIARVNCVSVHFVDFMVGRLKPPIPNHLPTVVCLDETFAEVMQALGMKTKWIRFVTNFSDGETGELLDLLPFRTKKKMTRYFLDNFPYEERCKVKALCCDMASHYLNLRDECFPHAIVCLDNFHVSNRLEKGFLDILNRHHEWLLSKSSGNRDPYSAAASDLRHLRNKFLTSVFHQKAFWGNKYNEYVTRMKTHLDACPELKDAYAMLQFFMEIFHASRTFEEKSAGLDTWISVFGASTSEDINRTVASITDHLPYIHNSWENGYSNATCEGNNHTIQLIKNMSYGIHDFDYFRTRSLLIAGRPDVNRTRKLSVEEVIKAESFFFDDYPSLEEYTLAYDWKNPRTDMSRKGE